MTRVNTKRLMAEIAEHYETVMREYEDGASAAMIYAELLEHEKRITELKEKAKSCMLADLKVSGSSRGRVVGMVSYGLSNMQVLDKDAWLAAKTSNPDLDLIEQEAAQAAERLKAAQQPYQKSSQKFYFQRVREREST